MKNIIGRKVGMTSVFTADGRSIPVTVISAGPCTVLQRKTADSDGYDSVALAYGDIKKSRLNKPDAGRYKKAGLEARSVIREFRDGIDGVEVFYITHTREQTELIAKRSAELGLLTTGSADFHGPDNRQFSKFMAFDTFGIEPNLGPLV